MDANPSTLARASKPRPSPARPPHGPLTHGPLTRGPAPAAADGAGAADVVRRPTRGDLLTVDPADRRRRAQTALLELVVTRSTERRRG